MLDIKDIKNTLIDFITACKNAGIPLKTLRLPGPINNALIENATYESMIRDELKKYGNLSIVIGGCMIVPLDDQ